MDEIESNGDITGWCHRIWCIKSEIQIHFVTLYQAKKRHRNDPSRLEPSHRLLREEHAMSGDDTAPGSSAM